MVCCAKAVLCLEYEVGGGGSGCVLRIGPASTQLLKNLTDHDIDDSCLCVWRCARPAIRRSHPINMRASDVSYEGESRVLQVSGTGNMFYTVRIS